MNRANQLFKSHQFMIYRRTDKMFATLMVLQYIAGIVAALYLSPRAWAGSENSVHLHVWMAVVLGFLIQALPVGLAIFHSGHQITRQVIAVGQMLMSALLIHLCGGRIETHFHVFGSLAFLGFYRDSRVLVTASVVVALDHYLRGVFWPQSVYGIFAPDRWRWLEHTGWVLFEDVFLFIATHQSTREMREIAERRAAVEDIARQEKINVARLTEAEGRLKDAIQVKDTFLSICSHELKTPLTALKLQSQLVSRREEPTDPGRWKRFSEQINRQVDRLCLLVDDMLDVSRLRMGKLSVRLEQLDLRELVVEVAQRCIAQAQEHHCVLTVEPGEAVHGQWDRFRMEQVVTNLIVNSCKYGAGKPVLVIVARSGEHARIEVHDQGIGIAHENLNKIFDCFERVSDQRSSAGGLGLGLFISRGIVEQHGGKIIVKSKLGQGSIFVVELPLFISEAAALA